MCSVVWKLAEQSYDIMTLKQWVHFSRNKELGFVGLFVGVYAS